VLRFVNQHYAPDVASTGQHLTDLAEYLAARGVPVEVVTARGHYVGGLVEAPARETRGGVHVRRLVTGGFGRRSRVGRILDYALFYLQVLWMTCVGPAPAATVFLTTPPLLGVIGWLGRRLRGRRYGIWSMDLHPDAEIAAGMLNPSGLVGRLLVWLNNRGYRAADCIVDLGPYMRGRILQKGVDPNRVRTVPVWGPAPENPTPARHGDIRAQFGIGNRWLVMYSGNAGIVHDFRDVLEAMRLLQDDEGVYFLFIGGGPRRPEIEDYIRMHGLRNVSYQAYLPREQVADALASADVHLITLRAAFAGISVPGKLYGIMEAGRPALFVGPQACETAETIRTAGCGMVVDPGEGMAAERVVAAIEAWRANSAAARDAGSRGRTAYVARFQRDPNCGAFGRALASVWPDVVPPGVIPVAPAAGTPEMSSVA
jgi:hypothetical protein